MAVTAITRTMSIKPDRNGPNSMNANTASPKRTAYGQRSSGFMDVGLVGYVKLVGI